MITRENYEEFFLSYIDNELPAQTRLAVDAFVAANPDLREELETLVQCRLEPESDAVFPEKYGLLQYEETLLSYVDGELDEAGRKTIEELTRREPYYEQELKRLQHTVSEPDGAIVFPGKESLYRPVKRRVVAMHWLQAVAAAAVVGVVVVLLLPHGHKPDAPTAAFVKNNPAAVTPPAASPLYSGKNASTATSPDKPKLPAPAVAENAAHRTNAPTYTAGRANTTPHGANGAGLTKYPAAASTQLASTDAATATGRATAVTGTTVSDSTAASNSTAVSNSTANPNPASASGPTTPSRTEKAAATSVAVVNIPKEQRSFATQQLLLEAQEEGDGDMAGNMPPAAGKTKLRGLFRRVTRSFGKTADRDDDGERQVSISVFQVALK